MIAKLHCSNQQPQDFAQDDSRAMSGENPMSQAQASHTSQYGQGLSKTQ